jgi:thiol-disulfide isomerase/thioredoxin
MAFYLNAHPKFSCIGLFMFAWLAADAQSSQVFLSKEMIRDEPGRFTGISNLFFFTPDSTVKVLFPKQWKNVETDVLTRTSKPVYIVRMKKTSGDYDYFVDLNNDNRIEEKEQLAFQPYQQYKIADFNITVPNGKGKTGQVAFQVMLAEKYIYARIREQRSGMFNFNNQRYKVILRPQGRGHIAYSKTSSQLFIDLNKDSALDEKWSVGNGNLTPSEKIFPPDPFRIDGKGFIVDSIDAAGEWISIRPFTATEAISEGYTFPALQLMGIDGKSLAIARNKYTLIEMWSIHCSFCESIRGRLNAFQSEMGDQLDWITISREQKDPVAGFIQEHSMNSKIAIATAEQWQYLNPTTTTPLFYLIDGNGNIVLKAAGANTMDVIEMIVKGSK